MTEAEVIDRINSTIKKNGKNAITGEEMNFVLKAIIQLIADSGGVVNWGDIEGTIADQLDLASALNGKVDTVSGKGLSTNDFTNTLKTKLDGIEAGAEVNVKADWTATSGDAEILNKPTIPDAADFVEKADYSPAHSILAQQSGTGSPTSVSIGTNQILGRLSGGGADIEGLSSSQVKTLLDLSGTNTGDETQSSILAKLGFYHYQINTASSVVTTTSPTIVGNIPIPANTYNAGGGKLDFNMFAVKTAQVGQVTIEAWLGPNLNNLSDATRIATTGSVTLNARYVPFRRIVNFDGTNITGLSFSSGNQNDDSANSNNIGSLAFDRTIDNYLMFVVTLASASDNAYLQFAEFKNF